MPPAPRLPRRGSTVREDKEFRRILIFPPGNRACGRLRTTRQSRNPCLPFSYYPAPRPPGGAAAARERRGRARLSEGDDHVERIGRWPQAAPHVQGIPRELSVRKAPVGSFPYGVAYLETQDSIRVLAFGHDRREPGYWQTRLTK